MARMARIDVDIRTRFSVRDWMMLALLAVASFSVGMLMLGCDLTAVYTQDDWDDATKRVETFIEHNNEVLDDKDLRDDPDVRQSQKDEGESLNVYFKATGKAGRGEEPRVDDDAPSLECADDDTDTDAAQPDPEQEE